jgi:hypothetical protein
MAHTFDNRSFIPGKQQTFYSVVSPSPRPDITNVLWEASSSPASPRIQSSSPQASPKPSHPPPSYEESVFNKALTNHHHHLSSTSNDSTYCQRQQPVTGKNHAYSHYSLSSNFNKE